MNLLVARGTCHEGTSQWGGRLPHMYLCRWRGSWHQHSCPPNIEAKTSALAIVTSLAFDCLLCLLPSI
jgi:hypothetical protein